LVQLDKLITEGRRLSESFQIGDWGSTYSKIPEKDHRAFYTSAFATIDRIAGKDSEYYQTVRREDPRGKLSLPGHDSSPIIALTGALIALREAVDGGLLTKLESRLRANVHDDFLEQAKELLQAGYHVAAMVLIGGVLEDHLHKMTFSRGLSWTG